MSSEHHEDEGEVHELVAEVKRLLNEVTELRAKNLELLRAAVQRDYERPPHYE